MKHPFSRENKGRRHLLRAVFAPILFELCGIIPLLLVVFGILNISAERTGFEPFNRYSRTSYTVSH